MQTEEFDFTDPEKRLKIAREIGERPALCVGDVVKVKRRNGKPRDDRLFVVLKIGPRKWGTMYIMYGEQKITYNGEDIVRIKEYKKKDARVIPVMRKQLWFTGKQLSL